MQNMVYIHIYTRAQALSDGFLVDVTEVAKEAGFKLPVAITAAVEELISNSPKGQDFNGRLWDVLFMAAMSIRANFARTTFLYEVVLPHYVSVSCEDGTVKKQLKRKATLRSTISPGDAGEPVITISLPDED